MSSGTIAGPEGANFCFVPSGSCLSRGLLVRMRAVPRLRHSILFPLYPALTRWANEFRRSAGGFAVVYLNLVSHRPWRAKAPF